jgi:uncharacterized protein YjbJ (UPF0337 family)
VDKDRIEGKAKEIKGKVTGDESEEAEGRLQGEWGEKKDEARGAWEELKDRAGEKVNERAERKEAESR